MEAKLYVIKATIISSHSMLSNLLKVSFPWISPLFSQLPPTMSFFGLGMELLIVGVYPQTRCQTLQSPTQPISCLLRTAAHFDPRPFKCFLQNILVSFPLTPTDSKVATVSVFHPDHVCSLLHR